MISVCRRRSALTCPLQSHVCLQWRSESSVDVLSGKVLAVYFGNSNLRRIPRTRYKIFGVKYVISHLGRQGFQTGRLHSHCTASFPGFCGIIPRGLALSLGITFQLGYTIKIHVTAPSYLQMPETSQFRSQIYHSYDIFASGDSRIRCLSSRQHPSYCVTDVVAMTQESEGFVKPKRCRAD